MNPVTVEVVVKVPVEKAWRFFTEPEHITKYGISRMILGIARGRQMTSEWAENLIHAWKPRMEAWDSTGIK